MFVHVHVHLSCFSLSLVSAEPLGTLGCLHLFRASPIEKLGVLAGLTRFRSLLKMSLLLSKQFITLLQPRGV